MPTTVASFNAIALSDMLNGFSLRSDEPMVMSRVWVAYPMYDASTIYLPAFTPSMVKRPEALVTADFTRAESLAASTRTEAWISPSPVAASTKLPLSTAAESIWPATASTASTAIIFFEFGSFIIRLRFFTMQS